MNDIEKVYKKHFTDVYYFLLSITKNKSIAEEITSETFFKVLKSKDKIKNEESIKSYLFTVSKNLYLDYLKKENKTLEYENIENIDFLSEFSAEEYFLKNEEEKTLYRAIEKLSEPQRSIVYYRAFENLSFSEIGKIYDKSQNWACVNYHRGKNKLKDLLEDYYD